MEKLEAEPPTVNETQSDAKWNEPKPDKSKDRAKRLMRRLSRRVNLFSWSIELVIKFMHEWCEGACDLNRTKNKFNRASTLSNLLTQCHVLVFEKNIFDNKNTLIIKIQQVKKRMRVAHVATDTREARTGVMSMTTIKHRERSSSW